MKILKGHPFALFRVQAMRGLNGMDLKGQFKMGKHMDNRPVGVLRKAFDINRQVVMFPACMGYFPKVGQQAFVGAAT